ncbi:hypothetical protein GCM10022228_03460 [Halomonas cibimaris]|uniref:Type I restriction modification DNA specificity domain-containing protein n=1 Tax=Halomonas cibimaris TaxID=657012 RepID=A0ABP7L834_9GAMM
MYEWKTIEKLADINPDTLSANTDQDFAFLYIDLGSVGNGSIDWGKLQRFSFKKAPSRARRVCNPGDSLFGTVRPNLQSHGYMPNKQTEPLVASTGFTVIRPHCESAEGRYLFFSLLGNGILRQSVNSAVGSNYPAVTDNDVRGFKLFAPPVEQQSKIADVLEAIDTQIHKTEALIAKLEKVKEGLLHDLLTRGIDENGQLRPSPEQAPGLYKESPLGLIPREWECLPLERILTINLGFAFSASDYCSSGTPSFRVSDIGKSSINRDEMVFLPSTFFEMQKQQQLLGGEIVLVMVGATTGKLGRVPASICPALQNQNMWRLEPQHPMSRDYLYSILPDAISRHMRMSQGSARDFLSQKDFIKTLTLIAPEKEQIEIIDRLRKVDTKINSETEILEKDKQLKGALMDDLLTGRVRVTPLLDQAQTSA